MALADSLLAFYILVAELSGDRGSDVRTRRRTPHDPNIQHHLHFTGPRHPQTCLLIGAEAALTGNCVALPSRSN